jgi:hypothetical protein
MWLVDPKIMCRKHLLGEHVEMHMLAKSILAGKSLAGYVAKGLIDTTQIQSRHDALAQEMLARGYKHNSPLVVPPVEAMGRVDSSASVDELARRFELCASRQNGVIDERDQHPWPVLLGKDYVLILDGDPSPIVSPAMRELLEWNEKHGLPDTPERRAALDRWDAQFDY